VAGGRLLSAKVAFSQSHAQAMRVFYSCITSLETLLALTLVFFSKAFAIPTAIPRQYFPALRPTAEKERRVYSSADLKSLISMDGGSTAEVCRGCTSECSSWTPP
jgi:hypothetical protein